MKRNKKVVIGCSVAAAVCCGIASYGHFYRGRMEFGWIFAVLKLEQLGLAVMNIVILKNRSKPKVVGGKVYESEGFGRNRPSE